MSYAFLSIPCYALNVYLWRYAGDNDNRNNNDALPPNDESSVEVSIVSSSSSLTPPGSKMSMSQRAKIAGSPKWSPHGKYFNQDNNHTNHSASKKGYEAVSNGGNGGVSRATAGRSLTSEGNNSNTATSSNGDLSPPFNTTTTTATSSTARSKSTCWHVSSVPLKEQPLLEQLRSKEFAFILLFAAVGILRANLYIGTNEQLLMNLGGETKTKKKQKEVI